MFLLHKTTDENWVEFVGYNLPTVIRAAANSTSPKGGVSHCKDRFVVSQTLVFQIKFCGKSPALRVAAKR